MSQLAVNFRLLALAPMLAVGWLLTGTDQVGAQPSPGSDDFFESRIRPLLHAHCLDCHSAEQGTAEGGLSLDSRQGWQRGGGHGPAIVPGDPVNSWLIRAVQYDDPKLRMPPDGRLAQAEVDALTHWIAEGALDPRQGVARIAGMTAGEAQAWWAIQPIPTIPQLMQAVAAQGASPATADDPDSPTLAASATSTLAASTTPTLAASATLARDPESPNRAASATRRVEGGKAPPATGMIDRLIDAGCQSAGLIPLGRAQPRTLVRRLAYNLTGLPPEPEVVERFAADDSAIAYERLVDDWLASPRYGQRWARHWLDLMRYADYLNPQVGEHRQGSVVEFYEAWKYRDWVVAAFNADLPYDQFLHAQICGDSYPPLEDGTPNYDGLVATTWMQLGPWDNGDADKHKIVADIVDDQINVLGQAMLAMTLACARCHDHKFDPVTIEDYYGLAGMFYSSRVLEKLGAKGAHTELLRTPVAPPEYVRRRAEQLQVIAEVEAQPESPERESRLAELRAQLLPEPPLVMAVREGGTPGGLFDGIQDVPVHRRGKYSELGPIVPRRLPELLAGDLAQPVESGSGRTVLAQWIASPNNPLTARVMANRIWAWHFGRGLVATPNNFGQLGGRPSHPELLDYLARRLIDSDWSIKSVSREILLSNAFQRDSLRGAVATSDELSEWLGDDPDNLWLARFSPRRLNAEEIRDSVLLLSGQLSEHAGGPADDSLFSGRRTLYVQSPRYRKEFFATLFDAADNEQPTEVRTVSTVAPQALFFMNHPWVSQAAHEVARQVLGAEPFDWPHIQRLYRRLLQRDPTAQEWNVAVDWMEGSPEHAADRLAELSQILLSTNELIYIE